MARVSFPIYKEVEVDGNAVSTFNKTINPSDISIKKNGVPFSTTVVNNNDGTYYFEITGSDFYTVLVNNSEQDEFKNI